MPMSQPGLLSSRTPAPGQNSPVAGWQLPPSPQLPAAKVGSLVATLLDSAPLLLSLFLPDTQLLLFIWITFLRYGISVVFPIPPHHPPAFPPVAGFLRRLVFGESCEHICSLSGSIPGGPRQGLGSQGARTRGAAEAGAHGSGPWQLRPVAGTSTAAGRAEPQGPWALPEPRSRGLPTPWPRWLWLLAPSAQVRVCQTWGGKESRGLRNDPGHCLLSSAALRGEGPMCGWCGRPRGVCKCTCVS